MRFERFEKYLVQEIIQTKK